MKSKVPHADFEIKFKPVMTSQGNFYPPELQQVKYEVEAGSYCFFSVAPKLEKEVFNPFSLVTEFKQKEPRVVNLPKVNECTSCHASDSEATLSADENCPTEWSEPPIVLNLKTQNELKERTNSMLDQNILKSETNISKQGSITITKVTKTVENTNRIQIRRRTKTTSTQTYFPFPKLMGLSSVMSCDSNGAPPPVTVTVIIGIGKTVDPIEASCSTRTRSCQTDEIRNISVKKTFQNSTFGNRLSSIDHDAIQCPSTIVKIVKPSVTGGSAEYKKFSYCIQCGRWFFDSEYLQVHLAEDHKDGSDDKGKPVNLQCGHCDMYFSRMLNLEPHLETVHTNSESQFYKSECGHCVKYFGNLQSLFVHITSTHVEERDAFQCADFTSVYCNEEMESKVTHVTNNAQVEVFESVPAGGQSQTLSKSIEISVQPVVHNNVTKEIIKCDLCEMPFTSKTGLTRHRRYTHPIISKTLPKKAKTFHISTTPTKFQALSRKEQEELSSTELVLGI